MTGDKCWRWCQWSGNQGRAGIPGVLADWGIRGVGAALIGRGTADRKMNCEVDSWEFRL